VAGYDFLAGVRVVEVAQLGPDALGGCLADMGASVIKVEQPPEGDGIRYGGPTAVGTDVGFGYLHLRWNRGKQSVGINLRTEGGANVFRRLVSEADVVIEGHRAGTIEKLGFGYEALKLLNPKIIFCSLSGMGQSGPYHMIGSHAPSFDALSGLLGSGPESRGAKYADAKTPLIGMHAMGLQAAIGVLAALYRAQALGIGASIEVAGVDAAASWDCMAVDAALNVEKTVERRGFHDETGRMAGWPRFEYYETRDGKLLFFQALRPKFWARFCHAVARQDLLSIGSARSRHETEGLWCELQTLFKGRDRKEWMRLFIAEDIPGCPVNDVDGLVKDPHFLARANVYDVDVGEAGRVRLTGTPIRVDGQAFAPSVAPDFAEHTDRVLRETARLSVEEIRTLREQGAIT
jgi:crotonobetainyl-CoA:carnitine CoA-transferase CaiB-like acyl-CoA transferase